MVVQILAASFLRSEVAMFACAAGGTVKWYICLRILQVLQQVLLIVAGAVVGAADRAVVAR